jgi:hypothetical protein
MRGVFAAPPPRLFMHANNGKTELRLKSSLDERSTDELRERKEKASMIDCWMAVREMRERGGRIESERGV